MDLKLTNYNFKNINNILQNYEFNSSGKQPVSISTISKKPIIIDEIIKKLSSDNVLSYKKDLKLNIIFEDFTNFTNLVYKAKNIIKKPQESSWHDEKNNTVHILKSDFNPNFSILSQKMIANGFSLNDVLNFIVLHEVGHAI